MLTVHPRRRQLDCYVGVRRVVLVFGSYTLQESISSAGWGPRAAELTNEYVSQDVLNITEQQDYAWSVSFHTYAICERHDG